MTSYRELREISLAFRRTSSNLLTATFETGDVQLERFKKFIDTTPFISKVITDATKDTDFDYNLCFAIDSNDNWGHIRIPADESCHIKAMYEYMSVIVTSERNLYQFARKFSNKSKFDEAIGEFLENAFKPLIDFINDSISREMILVEEDNKSLPQPITQHIGTVYGTVNQQGTGSIISHNVTNSSATEISELISKILSSFDHIDGIPETEIDDVKDDLESVVEQINSLSPKKNRLQKALAGIKKFASDFSMKLAVGLAVNQVTTTDWSNVIEKIEQFITTLI